MEILLEESRVFKPVWIDEIILKHWISWLIGRNPVSVEVERTESINFEHLAIVFFSSAWQAFVATIFLLHRLKGGIFGAKFPS